MLERLHSSDEVLRGRKVLVVDDDARNIFALTSVLESHEMRRAERRPTAARRSTILERTPDVAIVLMDIMMPEMDGYETMRADPQASPSSARLPILALTAKAMKGDREKCLEAGACDYIAKPVNTEQLLSRAARVAAPLDAGQRHRRQDATTRSTSCWSTISRPSC